MKRIAIFCDGTWNRADAKHPTNVVRLAQGVCQKTEDGVAQVVIYLEGVGSGRGSSAISRNVDRLGGGAFGWGLTENIVEAYRHLAFNHEMGDEIYIFGFSRGAYTARSLAGLIRSCGIPAIDMIPRIPEAVAFYRDPAASTKPESERSKEFRAWFSPALSTQAGEDEWRRERGLPDCRPLRISYLGVWDTVGALGVPAQYRMLAGVFNRNYQFHDARLTSLVLAARHAVAIDERRRSFEPTLWENVARLNLEARDEVAIGFRPAGQESPYGQLWFPGDHGSIGGGGDIRGLANAALIWVAEGARQAGLRFSDTALQGYEEAIDIAAPLRCRTEPPGFLDRILMQSAADRDGPADPVEVSDVARRRWRRPDPPPYRPGALRRVAAALDTEPQGGPG
jgi:uncharacterized protein (DUF2235 family)